MDFLSKNFYMRVYLKYLNVYGLSFIIGFVVRQ